MLKSSAAFLIAFAILLNAFGEHYLNLDSYQKSLISKATFYLIVSSLGCFVIESFAAKILLAGGIIFASTLIMIVFTGVKIFGAITPVGGLLMILAWLVEGYLRFKQVK